MFLSNDAKRSVQPAICLMLLVLLNVFMAGCSTLSPRAKEMLSLGDGDASGVPKLIEGLNDKDPEIRLAALASISKLGPQAKDSLPALVKLLTSPGSRDYKLPNNAAPGTKIPSYRFWDTSAVYIIGPKSDKGMQGLLLVDQNAFVSGFRETTLRQVIVAIGAIGAAAKPSVPAIASFLHDKQSWTGKWLEGQFVASYYDLRLSAAEALGKIGGGAKEALPDLEWALKDEEERLVWGCDNQTAYKTIKESISKIQAAK